MISIILPCYNQHEMTTECIHAIMNTTTDYEIVIIDNGSNPPIEPPFSGFNEIRIIRNEENLGFPVAVNQGLREAKGETIILLNNDVIATPEALNRLDEWLDEFSIVGPTTNYSAGLQRVKIPSYNNIEDLNNEAEAVYESSEGEAVEVNWVIGFCMAFRKSLWKEIGDFDESLWPCSGEEIDFCLRARENGHKIGIALDTYVHHEGSRTFSDMEDAGQIEYAKVCERNDKHLFEKWGYNFWKRQSTEIRLNVGCGRFPLQGFINIDQYQNVNPDIQCDVCNLPFSPCTVDEIYAGHVLEHFTWEEGQTALKHWFSKLKSGGKIGVCVPDFDALVRKYLNAPTSENLKYLNNFFIYSYVQDSPHKYCYNGDLLKSAIRDAGFININQMPIDDPHFSESVEWQIGFEGVKP